MPAYTDRISIVSSFTTRGKLYGKNQSRATHGFVFKIRGSTEYTSNGKRYVANEGEVVFLPQGSQYEYVTVGDDPFYTSINFVGDIGKSEIKVYSLHHFLGTNFIYNSFSKLLKFGTDSEKFKCISVFYDFLSYISTLENTTDSDTRNYKLIEPAIEYLKNNIFNSGLKIDRLHSMCGISDTYFRRIFLSEFNINPKEYVLAERLSHAKTIIEDGDFDSIKEVAESCGYDDSLYFSKAFKKHFGYSPSDINRG